MGRDGRQTTIYWIGDAIQVVCGGFYGDIGEFKAKIKQTHKSNKYAKEYLAWIKKVELFISK